MNEWLVNFASVVAAITASAVAVVTLIGIFWKVPRWTSQVDTDLGSLKGVTKQIQEDIKKILLRLPETPVKSGSPVQLTDFGEKIAESLEAEKWASELAEPLLGEISEMQPFQVDEFCVEYVKTELTEDLKKRVAACAYGFGIDKEGVRSVLRVVLRDKLLKRMKVR